MLLIILSDLHWRAKKVLNMPPLRRCGVTLQGSLRPIFQDALQRSRGAIFCLLELTCLAAHLPKIGKLLGSFLHRSRDSL